MKKKAIVLVSAIFFVSGIALWYRISGRGHSRTIPVDASKAQAAMPSAAAQVKPATGRLPLYFIQNRGQADPRARYTLRGPSHTVYLTDSGLLFDFVRLAKPKDERQQHQAEAKQGRRLTVGLDLVGANTRPRLAASAPKTARFNYLIGNDRSQWVTGVPAYGEVVYRDLYPAIDLRLYGDGSALRYDFIVRPGGRVSDIRLALRGIDSLRLEKGTLVADTEFGEMRQSEPVIYQETSRGRASVSGGFAVNKEHTYGFAVGAYDPTRPLVIDPEVMTLGYSTFLGGDGTDQAADIDIDGSGMLYVAGATASSNFPTTTGAYDTTINGTDVFVAKLDPGQTGAPSLVWCTFLGGSLSDSGTAVHAASGYPIVGGESWSDDFPLVNEGFCGRVGGKDGFIAQLDDDGAGLLFSMMFGTLGDQDLYDIDCSVNSVWACGRTSYGDAFYPAAASRVSYGHTAWQSYGDAYIVQVQINPLPTAIGKIIIMGGSSTEVARGIAIDDYYVHIVGDSYSSDFVTSVGAFDTSHSENLTIPQGDVFVAKFDYGGSMMYSTFVGDSNLPDYGNAIALGLDGAYICGKTLGAMPMVSGYDTSYANTGQYSGFMAKLNASGTALLYSTYIEPSTWGFSVEAMDIRTAGPVSTDCWVTGNTQYQMMGMPEKNYYHLGGASASNKDAFALRIDTAVSGMDSLLFVTNLGAGADDLGTGIVGSLNNAYVTGYTSSAGFPTANAFQATKGMGEDAFVSNLREPLPAVATQAATVVYSSSATLNGTLTGKSGAISYQLWFEYATVSGGPYTDTSHVTVSNSAPYPFNQPLSGLTPGTTYYFRAAAFNAAYGEVYGSELSFSTPAAAGPTVTTAAASAVTAATASSGGEVTAMGSDPVTARGVCWNTGGSPTTADSTTSDGSGTGSFTSSITGLTAGTLYHVRAYATNLAGTSYGNEVTFTTLQQPTVTTQAVGSIAATTASGHGTITSLGIPNPTAHGVCWNTSGTPTTADGSSNLGATSTTGAFTALIAGLTANTTYYVRAFATNSAGTAYGNEVSFTSSPIAPTVTTQAVSAIATTTATGNGTITSLGVPNPTAHGVCWNTGGTPTTADNATNVGGASSTGAFTAAIGSLTAGTTYFVRAFATNTADTVYGNEVSFITLPPAPVATAATSIGAAGFTANWNASTGAGGYRLDVSTSNTFATFVTGYNNLDVGNVTTYAVTGLGGGSNYYYRLRAYNASGTSADSNTITVLTVPPAPVATAATSIAETGFSANWSAAAGATGYRLDVSLSSTFASFIIGCNNLDVGNVTTYAVTGLTGSTTYYYRLRAYNASGTSADSNTITVLTVPPAPAANAATSITSHSFQANWNAAAGATGYRIDVATDVAFTAILPAYNDLNAGNVLYLIVNGLAPDTPYYYRLRASNASGSGANSNVISLTTLQVHTVVFTCSAGGWLAGTLTQAVDHGSNSSPVTANAFDGYHFDGWSGTGGFSSAANPLTVTNVLTDMAISGGFSNQPPAIRIINPAANANVWGLVNIQAEVSDDLAVRSVEFFVDNAPPATAAMTGILPGEKAPDSRLQMESGELYLDFRGADILLIDSQYRLRKASFQGQLQAVIGRDLPLRDLALFGSKQVHLLFAEPLRLGDGNSYSWILCDLEAGTIRGIAGVPIHLAVSAQVTAVQFDATGNAYYFTAAAPNTMTLCRSGANKTEAAGVDRVEAIFSVTGRQVRDWITLPDGQVLLSLFDPQTSQTTYLKVAGNGQRAAGFENGWAALLASTVEKGMAQPPAFNFLKVSHNRLLVSGADSLARSEWPARQWDRFSTERIEVADAAADSGGNLLVTGRDMLSGRFGLWRVGHSGCECLTFMPTACFRIAVLGLPAAGATVYEQTGTIPANAVAAHAICHSCDWDTVHCACGQHKISAVATDEAGAKSTDEILVNVANVMLSLTCQRFQDHGWLIKKNYIKVRLSVSNNAGAPVSKYVVYRRIGGGGEEIAKEFLAHEVQNGLCEFIEAAAGGDPATSYRAVALTANGMIIGASAHTVI